MVDYYYVLFKWGSQHNNTLQDKIDTIVPFICAILIATCFDPSSLGHPQAIHKKIETFRSKNCTNKQMLIQQYLFCLIWVIVIVVSTAPFESTLRHTTGCILWKLLLYIAWLISKIWLSCLTISISIGCLHDLVKILWNVNKWRWRHTIQKLNTYNLFTSGICFEVIL
jgi:hypothetical protein